MEKTIKLPEITDKLDHIVWYQVHLAMSEIQTHNVSGDIIVTDCTCNCKSNYQDHNRP